MIRYWDYPDVLLEVGHVLRAQVNVGLARLELKVNPRGGVRGKVVGDVSALEQARDELDKVALRLSLFVGIGIGRKFGVNNLQRFLGAAFSGANGIGA